MKPAALIAALAVAGWSAVISQAGIAGADPVAPGPPPGPLPGPTSAPPAGPAAKTTIDTSGSFAVGTDIAPGTYSTAGPVGDGVCYWKRTGMVDGTATTLDNAMSKKPQIVAIDPGDAAFKTDGCQPWLLTDEAAPAPPGGQLGALIAQAQLRAALNTLNNNARQYDGSQLPTP